MLLYSGHNNSNTNEQQYTRILATSLQICRILNSTQMADLKVTQLRRVPTESRDLHVFLEDGFMLHGHDHE